MNLLNLRASFRTTIFHVLIGGIALIPVQGFSSDYWVGLGTAEDPRAPLYWSDASNWNGGHVPLPQGLNEIDLFAPPPYFLFSPEMSVSEYNTRSAGLTRVILDTPAVFATLELGVNAFDATMQLEIEAATDGGRIWVNRSATVIHAQQIVASSVTVSAVSDPGLFSRYELSGTGQLGLVDFLYTYNLRVEEGGVFAMSGGTIHYESDLLDVISHSSRTALFQQSGGVANFGQGQRIGGGGNAVVEVSGGELNFHGSGGLVTFGAMEEEDVAVVGAKSTLRIIGGEVNLVAENPEGPLTLLIGEQYAGQLEISGSGALNVDGHIYLGGTQDGRMEMTGGTVQAMGLRLGMAEDPYLDPTTYVGTQSVLQTGGEVVLQTLPYEGVGTSEGLWLMGKNDRPNQYTLNGGTLTTYQTLVADFGLFFQNGGTHTAGALRVGNENSISGYTLTDGTINAYGELVVFEDAFFTQNGGAVTTGSLAVALGGNYQFQGGTLTAGDAVLRGFDAQFAHGAGLTFSVTGDAILDYGFAYDLNSPGGEFEVGGVLQIYSDSSIAVRAGVLSLGGLALYGDELSSGMLNQEGGNVVASGNTEIIGGRWIQSAGTTFHTANLLTRENGEFRQTGGIFSGRAFDVQVNSEMNLTGGTTTFGEDGTVRGSLYIGIGGSLTVRDLTIGPSGELDQEGTFSARGVTVNNLGEARFDNNSEIGTGGLQIDAGGEANVIASTLTVDGNINVGGLLRSTGLMQITTESLSVAEGGWLDAFDHTLWVGTNGSGIQVNETFGSAGTVDLFALVLGGTGVVNVTGGVFSLAGPAQIGDSAALNLSGGTLRTPTIGTMLTGLNWTGGTLHITNEDVAITNLTGWGSTLSLTTGKSLMVNQDVSGNGSILLDGGSLQADNLQFNHNSNAALNFRVDGGELTVAGDFTYYGFGASPFFPTAKDALFSNGASVSVGGDLLVGVEGGVSQRSTGSDITVAGDLILSPDEGNFTKWTMQGSFATRSSLTTGRTVVGELSEADFRQSSYTDHTTGELIVGSAAGDPASYSMSSDSTLTSGFVQIRSGAEFTAEAADIEVSNTFENAGDVTLTSSSLHAGQISNAGVMRWESSPSGLPAITGEIDNSGLIEIDTPNQTLTVQGTGLIHHNTGTLRLLDNSTIGFVSHLVNDPDGRIEGIGRLGTASSQVISDYGTLAPGQSPGLLTIYGDYTQYAGGILEMEIAGTAPSLYDRISVSISGSASFFGTLSLQFINGFEASEGDLFTLISGADAYSFSQIEVTGLDSTLTWHSYETSGLYQIQIQAVPEPSCGLLLLLSGFLYFFRRRKRSDVAELCQISPFDAKLPKLKARALAPLVKP